MFALELKPFLLEDTGSEDVEETLNVSRCGVLELSTYRLICLFHRSRLGPPFPVASSSPSTPEARVGSWSGTVVPFFTHRSIEELAAPRRSGASQVMNRSKERPFLSPSAV